MFSLGESGQDIGDLALEYTESARVQGLSRVGQVRRKLEQVNVVVHGKNQIMRLVDTQVLLSDKGAEVLNELQDDWTLHDERL